MKFGTPRGWFLGAAAYLIFLLATLPADYVVGWTVKHFPAVQLSGVSGSVFSGAAQQLRYAGRPLGAVEWHFDWLAPFTFTLGYHVRLHDDSSDLVGRVDSRFGTLYLRNLSGQLPVAALDPWSPLPAHSLAGKLNLRVTRLSFKGGRLTGAAGEVDLSEAALKWPTSYALGSFRLLLTDAGDGVHATADDVASPLSLQAALILSPTGAYKLTGTLAAHDPGDTATRDLLANLGRPDSTGRYPFSFNGQW